MLSDVILNGNQLRNFGMNQNRCQELFPETGNGNGVWKGKRRGITVPGTVYLIDLSYSDKRHALH